MDVDSLVAVLKGVLEEHGEEDAEERQHEDTTLFELRCCAIATNHAVHVIVKRGDDSQQLWGEAGLLQKPV